MSNKPLDKPIVTKVLRGAAAQNVGSSHAALGSTLESFTPGATAVPTTAADRLAQERAEALQTGYNDGLVQAQAEVEAAMADANKRVHRALAALVEAVESFDQRQTVALVDVEDAIASGAIAIASAILQREISVAIDPGADAIARALALTPDKGDVIARLNPEDVATLNMDNVSTTTRTVRVVADPNVEVGGCVVDAGNSRIDAQIRSALENVRGALKLTDDLPIEQVRPLDMDYSDRPVREEPVQPTKSSSATGRGRSTSRKTASEAPSA